MKNVCHVCHKPQKIIAKELGVCLDCIRNNFEKAKPYIDKVHKKVREEFKLPLTPPRDKDGLKCDICVNECVIGKGNIGYCGIRKNVGGEFHDWGGGALTYYNDFMARDCLLEFICPDTESSSLKPSAGESGRECKNLFVLYGACSFNCLFCQNWHFREHLVQPKIISAEEIINSVDEETSCVTFCGGDPTPQLNHAMKISDLILKRQGKRIPRLCFETDGAMKPDLAVEMMDRSLKSGGAVKYDIKAWNENLHLALTGISNQRTLENFKMIAEKFSSKIKAPSPLAATTLLVPGYIDEVEIENIAGFISEINPEIPYCLLAFYPQFYMHDLPPTNMDFAHRCLEIAKAEGLKHVEIGNLHLLKETF
jgi:pyruvate formate lyase activating enzyme